MATHMEVTHAWANQTGKSRKGFNMFYEGDTIYSYGYHFPIARIVEGNDRKVVLFTNKNRSVSTSKHKSYTYRAVNHMTIYSVDFMLDRHGLLSIEEQHAANIEARVKAYKEALKAAPRKLDDWSVHNQLRFANRAQSTIEAYVLEFGLANVPEVQKVLPTDDWFHDLKWDCMAALKAKQERAADPKHQAKLEAARLARENRKAREEEARRKGREVYYREIVRPKQKAWLRGEQVALAQHTARPLPRIKGDIIQTSWGASVPLSIGIRLYQKAVECRREHKEYEPPLGIEVGDFRLQRIKANGDLVVNCHDIPFWYMHYAAALNGIETPRRSV